MGLEVPVEVVDVDMVCGLVVEVLVVVVSVVKKLSLESTVCFMVEVKAVHGTWGEEALQVCG